MTSKELEKLAIEMEKQKAKYLGIENFLGMENFSILLLIKFLETKGILTIKEFLKFSIDNYKDLQKELLQQLGVLDVENIINTVGEIENDKQGTGKED